MNYADVAPAFVAASGGYDVWLGNSRGNKYSDRNVYMSSSSAEFWDFDWQEMGQEDIP